MSNQDKKPLFFARPAQFRTWLKRHHARKSELWVGFYRKTTGQPSITWPESVDEALCFGWIDGLRKSIDTKSYKIRFTPRRPTSVWSAINIRRIEELIRDGRVHRAGADAYARRAAAKSGIYSYENRRSAVLDAAAEKKFRADRSAWEWFQAQPHGYKHMMIWWIVSAKKLDTQNKRLATLIAESKAKRRIAAMRSKNT